MAGNLKTPIVLDFFGLPGCGKSTISHKLADEFRQKNCVVSEPTYDMDHRYSVRKRKIYKFLYATIYSVMHPLKAAKLYSIIRKCGNNRRTSIKLSITILSRISRINKSEDVVILDEGLTQMSISICQNSKKIECLQYAYNTISELISKKYNCYTIYLNGDIKTALERAEHRATKDSRVDREDNQQKKIEIYSYFDHACRNFACQANTSVCIDQDIDEIVSQLLEVL